MALVQPATLADLQKEIHTLFSNGVDYPSADEEDYQVRTALLNTAAQTWQDTDGIEWEELFDVKNDQTIAAAGDAQLDCPTTLWRPPKAVKLLLNGNTYRLPLIPQKRIDDDGLPASYCYISGTTGVKKLNLVGIPADYVGATVRYRFKRYATKLVAPTDALDMANPNYAVFRVVSILFQLAHNNTGFTIYHDLAEEARDSMISNATLDEVGDDETEIFDKVRNTGVMGS